MKKFFLMGIMVCLAMVANAQQSMEWYSYWGSNVAGSQINPQRMAVDKSGNIYVAALFGGNKVSVEGTTLSSNSSVDNGDAVIVKMDPNKTVLWTYAVAASGSANVTDITLDKKGNVILTGVFNKEINLGGEVMKLDDSNWGSKAIYVLKLDKNGNAIKAWQIPAVGATGGQVAVDSKNNIIVTGLLSGDAVFTEEDGPEGNFNNSSQLFVAKYDKNGNHLWHQFREDEESASVYGAASVALDEKDNIYVASSINGKTTLGGDEIETKTNNAFLICYTSEGKERWHHLIAGNRSDAAADIAVSPIGEVAIAINYRSGIMQIDGKDDKYTPQYVTKEGAAATTHTIIYTFDLSGEFKWYYYWGYGDVVADPDPNKTSGGDAFCHALRCTDEGVWYVAGMMTGRYGGKRLADNKLADGKNSGVETVDHQWMQHNTNGGWDCYLLTLTRDGELANVIRPGGTQYETGMDMALSPDKKSLYLLEAINVRDQEPYTCPDNIFDSFTDLYAPANDRKKNYTLLNVYCPENDGTDKKYTGKYKAGFGSSLLVKYAMPAINPNQLPYFTVGEAYEQSIALAAPKGKASIYQLGQYGDVNFNGSVVSGTFENDHDRYVGFIAIDSIPLPGAIRYYEYDEVLQRSVRSIPRNVRYMPLTIEKEEIPEEEEEAVEEVMGYSRKEYGRKLLRDGVLYIERKGRLYNAQGAEVR